MQNKVDNDLEPLPWASELVQVLTGLPVTVSIFEALSEVLTHQTTESSKLNSLKGNGTDSTLFPTSERTTSTSSTTTTTTQRPETTTLDLSDQVLQPNVAKSNAQLVNSRLVNSPVPDMIDSDPLSSTVPNEDDFVTKTTQTTDSDLSTLYLSQMILARIQAFQMKSEENLIGESFTERFESSTNLFEDSTNMNEELESSTNQVTIPESRLGDFLTSKPIERITESSNTEKIESSTEKSVIFTTENSIMETTINFDQNLNEIVSTEIPVMSSSEIIPQNLTENIEEIISSESSTENSLKINSTLPSISEKTTQLESQIFLTTMSIPEMIMSRIKEQTTTENSLEIASNMTVNNTMTNESINDIISNPSLLQNKTEAFTNAPIVVDRSINNSKAIKFQDSKNIFDKSSLKNNVPSDYVPRFSQSNRIAIAPFSATTKRSNFVENSTEKSIIQKTVSTVAQFDSAQIQMTSVLESVKLPESSSISSKLVTMSLPVTLETSSVSQTTTILPQTTDNLKTQSNSPQTSQIFSETSTKLIETTTETSKQTETSTQTEKSSTFLPLSSSSIPPTQNEILGNEIQSGKPKKTPPIQQFRLRSPKPQERIVYGILPNNTVVRKIIILETTTEGQNYIYGIYPNKTVVRKYRNGTIVPDQPVARIELTNIDPRHLTDPNSAIYRENAESTTQTTSVNQMVFYLLVNVTRKPTFLRFLFFSCGVFSLFINKISESNSRWNLKKVETLKATCPQSMLMVVVLSALTNNLPIMFCKIVTAFINY